jgi:hypothetical protein
MWKNVFDLTPIHPDYPNSGDINGLNTNLQKIINLRFKVFETAGISGDEHLDYQRKMELQNFISYSLCCMGDDHDCFFAVLQRYEVDSTKTFPATVRGKSYRYKWNKLIFGGTGSVPIGSEGSTTFHQIEGWSYDVLRSSPTQDRTWAINLNERGLTPGYLPPGWVNPTQSGFSYRPIGASGASPIAIGTAGNIFHIAKICKYADGDNYVYYFTAENVVDGTC